MKQPMSSFASLCPFDRGCLSGFARRLIDGNALFHRAKPNGAAVLHQQHLIAESPDQPHRMRGKDQDGGSANKFLDLLIGFFKESSIPCTDPLIEQEDLWVHRGCNCKR